MIIIGLLGLNAYLLWRILSILNFISLTPTNEDLWDIFSEYLSYQDPEEEDY